MILDRLYPSPQSPLYDQTLDYSLNTDQGNIPVYGHSQEYAHGSPQKNTASFQFGQDYTLLNQGWNILSSALDKVQDKTVSVEEAKEVYGLDIDEPETISKVRFKMYHQYLNKEMEVAKLRNGESSLKSVGWVLAGAVADPAMIGAMSILTKLAGTTLKLPSMVKTLNLLNNSKSAKIGAVAAGNSAINVGIGYSFYNYLDEDYTGTDFAIDATAGLVLGAVVGAKTNLPENKFAKKGYESVDELASEIQSTKKPDVKKAIEQRVFEGDDPIVKELKFFNDKSLSDFLSATDPDVRNTMNQLMHLGAMNDQALNKYFQVKRALNEGMSIDEALKTPHYKPNEPKIINPDVIADKGASVIDGSSDIPLKQIKGFRKNMRKQMGDDDYVRSYQYLIDENIKEFKGALNDVYENISVDLQDLIVPLYNKLDDLDVKIQKRLHFDGEDANVAIKNLDGIKETLENQKALNEMADVIKEVDSIKTLERGQREIPETKPLIDEFVKPKKNAGEIQNLKDQIQVIKKQPISNKAKSQLIKTIALRLKELQNAKN